MNSRQLAMEILFGTSNALWRRETRHEALLLLQALYAKAEDLRDPICKHVVAGPPLKLLGRQDQENDIDRDVFEILSSLRAKRLPLSAAGQTRLQEITAAYPKWEPSGSEGMSQWMVEGSGRRNVGGGTIKSLDPDQVAERIRSFQPNEWNSSVRDLSEPIGVRIAQEPEWGFRALTSIGNEVATLPEESFNPILWGIRAALSDNTSKLDVGTASRLMEVLAALVKKRPSPSAWSSLPSVMKDLVEVVKVDAESWDSVGRQLQRLFETFDFDMSESEKPVDWLQHAINHPYGDLTQIYLKLAQDNVNALTTAGQPLTLEPRSAAFLTEMSKRYGIGSRYGYSLTARRLAWMEAVAPSYAEVMRNWLNWSENEERALVAWSGYLAGRSLSRLMVDDFESTYEQAARRHRSFAHFERDGLVSHLAAVFWFHRGLTRRLNHVAALVDSEIRLGILRGWKDHLKNATQDAATSFFEEVVFPYWDWCALQQFFSVADGNKERLAFWELVPLAHTAFPEASRRARNVMPVRSESYYCPIDERVSESMFNYPDELVDWLFGCLELISYPDSERKEWRELWPKLQAKQPKDLAKLENELAKRGLDIV